MTLKNGHQFHRSKPPPGHENCHWRDPREKYPPATGGDWSCVLCGSWTTYCISAEKADEKMGPCPNRKDIDEHCKELPNEGCSEDDSALWGQNQED